MSRNSLDQRNVRKLGKVGGGTSYAVTLPIEIVKRFNWREGQKLLIEAGRDKTIIIKDWEK